MGHTMVSAALAVLQNCDVDRALTEGEWVVREALRGSAYLSRLPTSCLVYNRTMQPPQVRGLDSHSYLEETKEGRCSLPES